MTIYLYIKVHTKTGLKYFGKTTRNAMRYNGSGKYWKRHIFAHGTEFVKTLKIWEFSDITECTAFALKFSHNNNIVESKHWANLRPENGLDGAPVVNEPREPKRLMNMRETGTIFSKETLEKQRLVKLGKAITEETKEKMRGPRGPISQEVLEARKKSEAWRYAHRKGHRNGPLKHSEESLEKMRVPKPIGFSEKCVEVAKNRPYFPCPICGSMRQKPGMVMHMRTHK